MDEEEIDFSTKKLPKSNLIKIANASQQIRKKLDEKSSTVNTEHRAFLGHSQSESEKEDMTDTLPKPSSRAQSSPHSVHPSLGSFSRFSQEMTTLLDINKEDSTELEEEAKEDGGTREQKLPETPYLSNEVQAHSTSVNCAVRKDMMSALGLEEEKEAESLWDSECATESLPKESARYIPAATNKTIKDSISMGQCEDYLVRHPNLKPIQPTIEMKDYFTNREVEKGVQGNQNSNLMEEFGLDDADDIDDASDWDSTSTSQKNESYGSSKDLNFTGNYPCQSLPVTKNQSGSTEFGKIAFKEDEVVGTGSGLETGFKVVILGEKPAPQKQCEPQCPLKKEEDLTQELEFKGSSEESQESFDKSDPEEDNVTLETANMPEQAAPKKPVKPLNFPLSLKRMSQRLEPNKESHSSDVYLHEDSNWEERYEKMWVAKEKMEVKKNFKIITTELKQMFGEISEKNKIVAQPPEKLHEEEPQDGFEKESEQLQEASPNIANNSSDTEAVEKYGGPLNVGVQPFPEQREYSLENAVLQNLKLTFQENVLQSSSNLCSESSSLQLENDNKPEIECTCNLNEEDVAYDAENTKIANSQIAVNEMKEDGAFGMQLAGSLNRNTPNLRAGSGHLLQSSVLGNHFGVWHTCSDDMKSIIQEKKPKLTTATKLNWKTKQRESLFQNSDHNANNSTNEQRHWRHSLPCSDKMPKMHLDKELNQDMQRFKNELGILQVEFLALEKEKIQLQKEVEEEKKKHQHNEMETLEETDGDKLTENRKIGKVNELFSIESNQHSNDEENKIPAAEIPIMSISSKQSSAPVLHLLKGDSVMQKKEVKTSPKDKWISEDPGINSSCEKVNASIDVLLRGPEDSNLSEADHDEERPAKKIWNKKNKDKVETDSDDVDDLTQSSDAATEDYDLPPLNYKNVLLLIEQLSVKCKDPVSLLKIQDAVLRYERSVELKKGHCTLLARKVKSLENKITGLQKELLETREKKSQLEHQKAESDRELSSLRFTLKQEEEKRVTAEMLFEKIREQLRRKEEQCSEEVELKQQLEFTLRTLDLELKTVRNHLKQVEEERNDTQRQLSQELRARALQAGIQNNLLWKQKEMEAAASVMIQASEVPNSHEKEKYLLHKNETLQEEVAMLKLELDTAKFADQEKENRYAEENEVLKEKIDDLQKELKLSEEALTKTIFQYSGQVNVLTTENAMLNSKLENAKQNRDRLETEIESYRSRLTSAVRDHERSQTSKLDLEHTFQRERDEWLRLQDKLNHDLSRLRENNGVLSQELSKAESKANGLENELYHVRDSLREKTLILESTQRELNQAQYKAKELEHTNQLEKEKLNKYIVKHESIQERLAQIQSENMLLQQQLEDVQNKGIIKEKVLSDAQGEFIDLFNKLRADTEKQVLMVEERNKELISECERLREQMCKYENEKAEREATVRKLQQELADSLKKQSMTEASLEVTSVYRNDLEDKKKQLQKEIDQTKSKLNTEREKLKKLIELKQSLESRLEQEIKKNEELQKDLSGFEKLLKTTQKKLREYEKGDTVYEGELKQTHSDMDRQISRLKNKIEDLTQQLEAASSQYRQLESINQSLQEELFSMKILEKKCDKLEGNKKELEEEVANLRHHLEITKLERSEIEQYKLEIDKRARLEIVEKLKEVNLFLQIHAASQENLEQLRENNNTSIRNQMEQRISDLESELSKMKKSRQDSAEAELGRYRKLYSEELKIRKSLSNKLDRTNERLAEVSHRLLNEKEKNKILITSFTASPVLGQPHVGNVNTSMVLSRGLIPRGNLAYSTGNIPSSKSGVEGYLAKMRQELKKSIARELDEAGFTNESSRMPNLNQDPVSLATQEYLEVLKKNYML
ncbi:ankyrin repeat domain-containing protein 26-like isoform X2 [Notamacropus eugenii]|uniref:ankyrin repeat domain-containing protein 26-like isoform X2 n=1 Tax=Notamacropus eugenii TaxID=9315 RepID=UPI003B6780DB